MNSEQCKRKQVFSLDKNIRLIIADEISPRKSVIVSGGKGELTWRGKKQMPGR